MQISDMVKQSFSWMWSKAKAGINGWFACILYYIYRYWETREKIESVGIAVFCYCFTYAIVSRYLDGVNEYKKNHPSTK